MQKLRHDDGTNRKVGANDPVGNGDSGPNFNGRERDSLPPVYNGTSLQSINTGRVKDVSNKPSYSDHEPELGCQSIERTPEVTGWFRTFLRIIFPPIKGPSQDIMTANTQLIMLNKQINTLLKTIEENRTSV